MKRAKKTKKQTSVKKNVSLPTENFRNELPTEYFSLRITDVITDGIFGHKLFPFFNKVFSIGNSVGKKKIYRRVVYRRKNIVHR